MWKQIYEELLKEIHQGAYRDKSDFLTLKECCEKFGVSNITAQRVFKELKANGHIATIGRRGAIVTSSRKTNRILLCLFQDAFATNNFFRIHSGYQYYKGFFNLPADTPFEICPISEAFLWDNLDRITDDLVITADLLLTTKENSAKFIEERLNALRAKIKPVVIHSVPGLKGFPQVSVDYRQGFYNATTYLLEKGHTNIAFMMSSRNLWHMPRLKGHIDALEKQGCIYDAELTRVVPPESPEAVWNMVSELLGKKKVSAVICSSDAVALQIHCECRSHGIRIPDDLAIMGFDNISESSLVDPELTTVDSHLEQFGKLAVQLLERRRAGFCIDEEALSIVPTLIARKST